MIKEGKKSEGMPPSLTSAPITGLPSIKVAKVIYVNKLCWKTTCKAEETTVNILDVPKIDSHIICDSETITSPFVHQNIRSRPLKMKGTKKKIAIITHV